MSGVQAQGNSSSSATNELLEAIAGLVTVPYDTVEVTYTDDTKEFISTVEFYAGGTGGILVDTITATYPTSTTEVYTNL